jgi:hypothetical protein
MAVVDKYVILDTYPNAISANAGGSGDLRKSVISFEVAAADDDGSVYRLMQINANSIITDVKIGNDKITSGTSYDVGFYNVESGAVVDADELAATLDLSSAHASGSELSGISAVDVANRGKKVYELLGLTSTTKAVAYDLCITANTVGSAAGTITVFVEWIA